MMDKLKKKPMLDQNSKWERSEEEERKAQMIKEEKGRRREKEAALAWHIKAPAIINQVRDSQNRTSNL